ncbi:MAG: hypothetical protein QW429_00845 [Thermoprotei archaeon]
MTDNTLDPMAQLNFGRLETKTTYLVVGSRGAGKTLFCMLAAISYALRDMTVLYTMTQGDLSFNLANNLVENYKLPKRVLKNITFMRPNNRNAESKIPQLLEELKPSIFILDEAIWSYGNYVVENFELAVYRSRLLSGMLAEIHSLRERIGFTIIYTADIQQGGRILADGVLNYFSDTVVELSRHRGNRNQFDAALLRDGLKLKSYSYTIDKLGFRVGEHS